MLGPSDRGRELDSGGRVAIARDALDLGASGARPGEDPTGPIGTEPPSGLEELAEAVAEAEVARVEKDQLVSPTPRASQPAGRFLGGALGSPERRRLGLGLVDAPRCARSERDDRGGVDPLFSREPAEQLEHPASPLHDALRGQRVGVDVHHPECVGHAAQTREGPDCEADVGRGRQGDAEVGSRFDVREPDDRESCIAEVVERAAERGCASPTRGRDSGNAHSVEPGREVGAASAVVRAARAHDLHLVSALYQHAGNVVEELAGRGRIGRIELIEEKEAHRLAEGTRIGLRPLWWVGRLAGSDFPGRPV